MSFAKPDAFLSGAEALVVIKRAPARADWCHVTYRDGGEEYLRAVDLERRVRKDRGDVMVTALDAAEREDMGIFVRELDSPSIKKEREDALKRRTVTEAAEALP